MTVTSTLRDALRAVRTANPDAIRAIDDEDRRQAEQTASEAKRRADLAEKVAKAVPARADAIVADWVALEQDALHAAAEALAREQLAAELGLTDPRVVAMHGFPTRLTSERIALVSKRLAAATPLPWRKGGQSASAYLSEVVAAAAEQVAPSPLSAAEAEDLAATRRTEMEQRRAAAMAARKAAGIGQ